MSAGCKLRKSALAVLVLSFMVHVASAADTLSTWLYSAVITLNTSPTGANIMTTQKNFPVLIRLNAGNAAKVFAEAKTNGGDLRFTRGGTGDTSQLPYELNKYNAANQTAIIWVKTDSVQGNNATQSINMYWGKSSATTTSDSGGSICPRQWVCLGTASEQEARRNHPDRCHRPGSQRTLQQFGNRYDRRV